MRYSAMIISPEWLDIDTVDNIIHLAYYIDFVNTNREAFVAEEQRSGTSYIRTLDLNIQSNKNSIIQHARSKEPGKWLNEWILLLEQSIQDFESGICRRPFGQYHPDFYHFMEQLILERLGRIHSAKSRWVRAIETYFLIRGIHNREKMFFHSRCPQSLIILLRSLLRDIADFKETLVGKARSDLQKWIFDSLDTEYSGILSNIHNIYTAPE